MAHPCINCGSECYCCGDIDDAIVSRTPRKCEGCGCEDDRNDDDDFDDDDSDFQPCDQCDLPDACDDFGCAIKSGIKTSELF